MPEVISDLQEASIKVWMLSDTSSIVNSSVNSSKKSSEIRDPNTGVRLSPRSLTKSQAFLVGFLAKTIATVATYPLIRAKVTMMSSSSSSSSSQKQLSLSESLTTIYQVEGFGGFYKGLSVQLSHTALKNATLMMIKEEIDRLIYIFMLNAR